jgi:hypothetical protein
MKKSNIVVAIVLATCSVTNAATITFDSLSGANGNPYLGHVESGFNVIPFAGTWQEAHLFGNPIPDIFGINDVASIQVTGMVSFTFASVDLADGFFGSCTVCATFSITGFLNNNPVLNMGGTTSTVFQTFLSSNSSQALDRLVITMNKGTATYNIDNIVVNAVPEPGTVNAVPEPGTVNAVPEPGTLFLFGVSLTGLLLYVVSVSSNEPEEGV